MTFRNHIENFRHSL